MLINLGTSPSNPNRATSTAYYTSTFLGCARMCCSGQRAGVAAVSTVSLAPMVWALPLGQVHEEEQAHDQPLALLHPLSRRRKRVVTAGETKSLVRTGR